MGKSLKLNSKGFTLAELVISLAVGGFVLIAILSVLGQNLRYNKMAQDQIFIQDQVRDTIQGVSRLIMDKDEFTPRTNGAVFRRLLPAGSLEEVEFIHDPGTGELKYVLNGNATVLARDITAISFKQGEKDDGTPIPNLIELTVKGERGRASFEITEKIVLRNMN